MNNSIEQEIRQYKMDRIVKAEKQLENYRKVYHEIKENIVVTLTKYSGSVIMNVVLFILLIVLFLLAILFLFPSEIITLLEAEGESFTKEEKAYFISNLRYLRYLLFGIGFLLILLRVVIKSNNNKRLVISNLSDLMTEVIENMDENLKEDKKKYEYFIEGLGTINHKDKSKEKEEVN